MGIIYLLKCNTVYIVSNRLRGDIPFEILKILCEIKTYLKGDGLSLH